MSTALFSPIGLCSDYFLRLTSFIASLINLILFYFIRLAVTDTDNKRVALLEALTLSFLPPLYFFSHLYYTDVAALMTALLTLLCSLKGQHALGSIAGIASVAMRQTNIVWVALIFCVNALNYIVARAHPFLKEKLKNKEGMIKYTWNDLRTVVDVYLHRPDLIWAHFKEILAVFYGYLFVLIGFVIFVWHNGSFVVGDKSAHEAAVHVSQIFYFSLFVVVFAPSLILTKFKAVISSILKYWYVYVYFVVLISIIVYINTLVHPYLLADNRHYTFYVWNRFFGKYNFARFVIIPVYLFTFATIWEHFKSDNLSIGFIVFYTFFAAVSLALQKLVEIRYFLFPYIFLRLHLNNVKPRFIVLELVLHLIVNAVTFYIFFTKEITWSDYTEPQRLIW